jgi:hypothetical protein
MKALSLQLEPCILGFYSTLKTQYENHTETEYTPSWEEACWLNMHLGSHAAPLVRLPASAQETRLGTLGRL